MTGPRGRRPLDAAACAALLGEIGWGTLAVVEYVAEAWTPIAVPVAYAFDEGRIYLALAPGRKVRALERNPRACLTVMDVRSLGTWRSVVVVGRARWLAPGLQAAGAVEAFLRQRRPEALRLASTDSARFARSRLAALEVMEMHGWGRTAGDYSLAPPP